MEDNINTNKIISNNLQRLMSKADINNKELAKIVGVDESTVGKWLLEKSTPRMGAIELMAEYFGVQKSDILERPTEKKIFHSKPIPLIGQIAAGVPILAEENIDDYFYIDKSIKADFCLRIKGDSMIDEGIYEDDIVFIKSQPCIENGEIGAVIIGDEATLKRVYKGDDNVILQPANRNYKAKTFSGKDIRIAGKLVAVLNIRS